MIATDEEEASLFACLGSQHNVFYIAARKHALVKTIQSERVTNAKFSVSVSYGHLQHAGAKQGGFPCFHYHSYSTWSDVSLNEVTSFRYGASYSMQPIATDLTDDSNDNVMTSSEIAL